LRQLFAEEPKMPRSKRIEEKPKKQEHQGQQEKPVPLLKALEQLGGEEYDFFIELPRREVWKPRAHLKNL
jgi:hypothetical protein